MKESKIKIVLLALVTMLVITILFSNIGQNFKVDISSYDDTAKHFKTLKSISYKAKSYQKYLNSGSNYISRIIRSNNFSPEFNNKYLDEWMVNTPFKEYTSTLEVIDNNSLVKKYKYGQDFIEDYRGLITSGSVKSNATYEPNLESIHNVLSEVLLFEGYNKLASSKSIIDVDVKLKSLGASGIISPIDTKNPLQESGLYDQNLVETKRGKGIAKLLVNRRVFNELKTYAENGFTIKMNSGAVISPISYKNVYGVINGKKTSYKPLIICVFYDGPYNTFNNKYSAIKNYLVPASLALDCVRVVNKQRLRKPDRTIVFAFLSGYSRNLSGLSHLIETHPKANLVFLDGIGLKDNLTINYGKNNATISSSAAYFLDKFGLNVVSRNKDVNMYDNLVVTSIKDINSLREINSLNITRSNNSSHFLLSFIEDECYNLNIITENIRPFRTSLRFIRDHSAILSVVAICFLILVLFFPINKIKKNRN